MADGVPAEALARAVGSDYPALPPVTATVLRRGFNDHYHLVVGDGRRWVGRVYLAGKYYAPGPDAWGAELDLLVALAGHDVPVAAPVRRSDGRLLGLVGNRWYCVFPYADGAPVSERSDDPAVVRRLGEVAGALHVAGDTIGAPAGRYTLDNRYLVDEPVRVIEALLSRHGHGDLSRWRPALEAMKAAVERLGRSAPRFGLVHGDLHGGNAHVGDGGEVTLFDFDHCATGWRAYDLAVSRMAIGSLWPVWLDGYRTWREPDDAELESLDTLSSVRQLWDVGDMLAMRPVWQAPPDDRADAELCDGLIRAFEALAGAGTFQG